MFQPVSLREQLSAFITDEKVVNELIQQYHRLVMLRPSWRIGGFVSMVRSNMRRAAI
jgi:hypothetical protein